ncbi:tautomerase family protein [Pseudoduganella plicata]|nr:tautomerase family protein [Pseudoduganella plicata]
MSRISLQRGKSSEYLRAVSDSLHRALVEALDVPPTDRFQLFDQHEPHEMSIDPHYPAGTRSADYVFINVIVGRPRSAAMKAAFYQRLVALLAQSPGVRPEDVMVVIASSQSEDWSFGSGVQGLPLRTDSATAAEVSA